MGSSCCRHTGHIPHDEIIILHDQVKQVHASPKFGAQLSLENNATQSKERDDCVSPMFGHPVQDEFNEQPSIENAADIELSVSSLKSILKTELKYINPTNQEKTQDRKVRFIIE